MIVEPEPARVMSWRYDELRKAGYPVENAVRVAESEADLHIACDLLKQGATVMEAMRILL
jgi:hypothetical protein